MTSISSRPLIVTLKKIRSAAAEEVGTKAIGLATLPRSWVPSFFVLSARAHIRWREDPSALLTSLRRARLVYHLTSLSTSRLILRSSAPSEGLEERGRFESLPCDSDVASLFQTASRIWRNNEQDTLQVALPLVVQAYKAPLVAGHLSNERRVSRRKDHFLLEIEGSHRIHASRIAVRPAGASDAAPDLACRSKESLSQVLKSVGGYVAVDDERKHLEWLWDGQRIWIVQIDRQDDAVGERPPTISRVSVLPAPLSSPKALTPITESTRPYRKIEVVRAFGDCGLPTAPLYVLDNVEELRLLATGQVSELLRRELNELLAVPIVIRTAIAPSATEHGLMHPRTDSVTDVPSCLRFLREASARFREAGQTEEQYCFILHRFINSRSAAWALATPESDRVRIDATWGLPDGLSYYPHDSFEIHLRRPEMNRKRIRCKTHFLAATSSGKWRKVTCRPPWDWKDSVNADELMEVASASKQIAGYYGKPVHVMFFVGAETTNDDTSRSVLPWFVPREEPADVTVDKSVSFYAGERRIIRSHSDLDALSSRLADGNLPSVTAIQLDPVPELLRNPEFLRQVANIAKGQNWGVELVGSVLSHAYYLLDREGVKVKTYDPLEHSERSEKFGKLVRDRIPTRIEAHGEIARIARVDKDQLRLLLKAKAVEEALELFHADSREEALDELADLLEVVKATLDTLDVSMDQLEERASSKRNERGGFREGVVLVETKAVPLLGRGRDYLGGGERAGRIETARASVVIGKSLRAPEVRGNRTIHLAMVPPHGGRRGDFVLETADPRTRVVVRYEDKEIVLIVLPEEMPAPDMRQLALFDNVNQ